jgi:hypothetical protein
LKSQDEETAEVYVGLQQAELFLYLDLIVQIEAVVE